MFYIGKKACIEDLASIVENGASLSDCIDVIDATLGNSLDKRASEEDIHIRMGIESACYDFLKEASHTLATGSFEDEPEMLYQILTKMAQSNMETLRNLEPTSDSKRDVKNIIKDSPGDIKNKILAGVDYVSANPNVQRNIAIGGVAATGLAALGYYGYKSFKNKERNQK